MKSAHTHVMVSVGQRNNGPVAVIIDDQGNCPTGSGRHEDVHALRDIQPCFSRS